MTPPKHIVPPAPFIPPGYCAPTNAIPATIPCPACGAPAAVSALEDRRAPAACILYLTARCACGLRLDAGGVDKNGHLPTTERVALEDLRAVYRRRKVAMDGGHG